METVSVLVFIFFLLLVAEARSTNRTACKPFPCGELDFKFPFFSTTMPSRCGLFKLNCGANIQEIQFEKDGKWYKVKSVSQANTITITDTGLNQSLITGHCSDLSSFSLPDSPWLNLTTLYKCNNSRRKNDFSYANCRGEGSSLYYNLGDGHDVSGCSAMKTPESWVTPRKGNQYDLNATFSLHIKLPPGCLSCHRRGGECKMIKDKYHCDGVTKEQKYDQERIKLGLVIGGSLILIIILMALFIIHRICRRKAGSELSRDNSKSDVE